LDQQFCLGHDGCVLPVAVGGSPANAVVHSGDEDLGEEFFAEAPILRKAGVLPGFCRAVGLQSAGGGEQDKLGAVGVVLQGVAVELGEALPVAKLPLGAGAFEGVSS